MQLGVHNEQLMPSLHKSDVVLIITKNRMFKSLARNNNKINVIESEVQIGQYLKHIKNLDIILILSNKNTNNVKKYLK